MKELDKTNIIVSILHIRSASKLLEVDEPTISLALLELSKGLIVKNNLLNDDLLSSEKIVEELDKDE